MKNHYNKILLLLGLFTIMFILYNRLLRIRLPKNFIDMTNSPYYIIYILIIISFMVALCITLHQIYLKLYARDNKPNFIIQRIKKILEHPYNPLNIISEGMITLDSFIKNHTPYYDDQYSYSDIITKKMAYTLLNTKRKIRITIIFFQLIPQATVCICFLIDILFHDKFVYFYPSLILLLLPLILKYIMYSINAFIETNLEGLNNFLTLKIIPSHKYTKEIVWENCQQISIYEWRDLLLMPEGVNVICNNNLSQEALDSFKGDTISAKLSLERAIDDMNILFIMNNFITSFRNYKFIFETPFNVIKYILYIIGWLYLLDLLI